MIAPLIRKARKTLNLHTSYQYGRFSIQLPADHLLPYYQSRHPHYDRFLPHLAAYVEPGRTIVDVGANCADSVAAMVERNSAASYVCIEPDDVFFRFLQRNIGRIKSAYPGIEINAIRSLVGLRVTNASLEGSGGTRHAIVSGSAAPSHSSKTLDAILQELPSSEVRLIKSDVDGFDFDVLDSAATTLQRHRPLIFFECQYEASFQLEGYRRTMLWLSSLGYSDWAVFDNYGDLVTRTADLEQVLRLMEYVWRQNTGTATRTIYYYDILAANATDSALIDSALSTYP